MAGHFKRPKSAVLRQGDVEEHTGKTFKILPSEIVRPHSYYSSFISSQLRNPILAFSTTDLDTALITSLQAPNFKLQGKSQLRIRIAYQ